MPDSGTIILKNRVWITLYCVSLTGGEYGGISNVVEEVRLRVKRRLRR